MIPPSDSPKVEAAREILTASDPGASFQAQLQQLSSLAATIGPDSASRLLAAIGAAAFDVVRDSAAIRAANAALARRMFALDLEEASPSLVGATAPLASSKRTVVIFVNGVLNTPFDALSATIELKAVVKESGASGLLTVANHYNASAVANDGSVGACLWNRYNRFLTGGMEAWAITAAECFSDFKDARQQILNLLSQSGAASVEGEALSTRVKAQLLAGNAVVLAGHSQGSLIAQEAIMKALVQSGAAQCLGYVQIAAPLTLIIPGLLSSHFQGIVIRGTTAKDVILSTGLNSDPSVTTAQSAQADAFLAALAAPEATRKPFKVVGNWTLEQLKPLFAVVEDVRLHGLTESYLASPSGARASVRDKLKSVINAVQNDCVPIPSKLVRVSGDGQSATVGQSLNPFVARVTDAADVPVEGVPVSFAVVSGPGSLSASSAETNSSGRVSTTLTLGDTPGQTVVRAISSRIAGASVDFTSTATAAPTPTISMSASTFSFAATSGGNSPSSQDVQITNSGTGTLSGLSASVAYQNGQATGWLTASLDVTTAPAKLTVNAATGTLPVGTYNGTVSIASTATGVTNSPRSLTVTFSVSAAANAPTISISSSTLSFAATVGGSSPAVQDVQITNSGSGTLSDLSASVTYQEGQTTGWLTTTLSATSAPATLSLAAVKGTLVVGTYKATVSIASTASGVTNSPRSIAVTFTVSEAAPAPTITVSASSVGFSAQLGGTSPAATTVSVTNGGTGTLSGLSATLSYQEGQASGWLAASLNTATAPSTLTLTATLGTLGVGTHNATVSVASTVSGVTNSPKPIAVTLTVSAAAAAPTIALSAATASFSGVAGSTSPAAKNIEITNSGSGTLSGLSAGTINYMSGEPTGWLTAALSSTTSPSTVTLTPTVGTLAAGSYHATVPILSTATGVTNSPREIAVIFTVAARVVTTVQFTPSAATVVVGDTTRFTTVPYDQQNVSMTGVNLSVQWWLIEGGPDVFDVIIPTSHNAWVGNGPGKIGLQANSDGNVNLGQATITVTGIAVPKLRLSANTVSLLQMEGSASMPTDKVRVENVGTGRLNPVSLGTILYASPGPTNWLSAQLSTQRGATPICAPFVSCYDVVLAANTTGLSAGSYSASLNVASAASNVLDSPQAISVTLTIPSFQDAAVGALSSCARTSGGTVFCWGSLPSGIGAPVAVGGALTFQQLVVGRSHYCGLTSGGSAYCWGSNTFGQLGDGTGQDRTSPTLVAGSIAFQSIASGLGNVTCGLTNSGAAYCWGQNGNGQLGDGSTSNRLSPVAVQGGHSFQSLAVSATHECGLTSSGAAHCWGWNVTGELGDGTQTSSSAPVLVSGGPFASIVSGDHHTCALTNTGAAYCWGRNVEGAVGGGVEGINSTPVAVSGGLTFQSLNAGLNQTCGVATSGAAYCWGWNISGQIGDGTTTDRLAATAVTGGLLFRSISTGERHTCGITTSGQAYCWGWNQNKQLGDGTSADRLTPTLVLAP